MKIAFITPTKDRPDDIRKMLSSYMSQTRRPDQVIIVDSSLESVSNVVHEFPHLEIAYKRWEKTPSAADQRNGGIELLRDDIDLVCFFDDDQILHVDAIEKMVDFWQVENNRLTPDYTNFNQDYQNASNTSHLGGTITCQIGKGTIRGQFPMKELGATSFYNTDNDKDTRSSRFKNSWLSNKLGLYTDQPGCMARSGWQSLYGNLRKNTDVEWMGSGALVIRNDILKLYSFDNFFEGNSYLEDLDFSYTISRKYRLTVVVDAKFDHFHSSAGRDSLIDFGKIEVRNRKYIVKKHGLSITAYRLGMFVRFLMSVALGQFDRAFGNIIKVFQ